MQELFEKYGIKQIGYYVESIEDTAKLLHDALGVGPFVDLGTNPPASCSFRGQEIDLLSRCALGQLGEMQIELIEVKSTGEDPYKEMGRYGIHHFCIWVDDVDAAVKDFSAYGIEPAMTMVSGQGLKVVYLDAREQLGHYIEVNEPLDQLAQGVKALHEKWTGDESLVDMKVLMGG